MLTYNDDSDYDENNYFYLLENLKPTLLKNKLMERNNDEFDKWIFNEFEKQRNKMNNLEKECFYLLIYNKNKYDNKEDNFENELMIIQIKNIPELIITFFKNAEKIQDLSIKISKNYKEENKIRYRAFCGVSNHVDFNIYSRQIKKLEFPSQYHYIKTIIPFESNVTPEYDRKEIEFVKYKKSYKTTNSTKSNKYTNSVEEANQNERFQGKSQENHHQSNNDNIENELMETKSKLNESEKNLIVEKFKIKQKDQIIENLKKEKSEETQRVRLLTQEMKIFYQKEIDRIEEMKEKEITKLNERIDELNNKILELDLKIFVETAFDKKE